MNAILIGSFIIIVTGVVDDINPIPAKYKFICQIAAATIVVLYGGLFFNDITLLYGENSVIDYSYDESKTLYEEGKNILSKMK